MFVRSRILLILALRIGLLLPICTAGLQAQQAETEIEASAFAKLADSGTSDAPLFSQVPAKVSGISFVNPIDTTHELKRLYIAAFACGGIALGDVDGDGRLDVFLTGGAVANRLFRQVSPWKFEDITQAANPALDGNGNWSSGAAMADIDGDGDLDILVGNYDKPLQLFINQGADGGNRVTFTEEAAQWGLDVADASLMPSFCDFDNDGDLDVFLQCGEYQRANGRPAETPVIEENGTYRIKPGFEKYYAIKINEYGKQEFVNAGRANYLFRNEGTGKKFTDITTKAGLSGRHITNSATWWDYDGDGSMDLYEGNDFRDPDRLYRNNGDGTFTDVIKNTLSHTTWFSMGADVGDVNNDLLPDFLIADMAGTSHYVSKATMGEMGKFRHFLMTVVPRQFMRNALYVNTGTPRFQESSFMSGIASTDWTWAVKLADFDNDGRLDAYFTNGVARSFNDSDNARSVESYVGKTAWDHWERFPQRKEQNLAYRNVGELKFANVSESWGLAHNSMSYSAATGDIDGDGDLDLLVASLDEEVTLYRNDRRTGSSIKIRLQGSDANTFGIGAKVTVVTDAETAPRQHVRHLIPATGFLSSNEPELHFGLGDAKKVVAISVQWAHGETQQFTNLPVNHRYAITAQGRKNPVPKQKDSAVFVRTRALEKTTHQDVYFDDYERQPLLPWRHSNLGPGMAWGDVDGDGDPDLYLGAAKGQAGVIHRNEGGGKFTAVKHSAFDSHKIREDMAPLFFDADGDGDLDLYVVSGSSEFSPAASELADRLYLNDGKDGFSDGSAALPSSLRAAGSCAVSADFDRDGDLDVFVGGRVIPGAWPETPQSALLENISADGKAEFRDATAATSGSLASAGLVTGAIWSDINDDAWPDLLVTCEWGPVRVFLNQQGDSGRTLVDNTDTAGLGKYLGWWNGIAAGDVDHDGDIDFVATNFGLNTQYKASPKKPELLYYGDLDGTGKKHIVEAKFEGSICYPRRGLSCSSHAMPNVRKLLPTFKKFAMADLQSIYTRDRLESAQRFEVTHLESSLLLNDGTGRFSVKPLPRLAQLSPSFGVVLADFDLDGHLDCALAQNFFSPQPETGNMDGGLGMLLHGKGNGTFEPLPPKVSGIVVPADSKSLTAVDLDNSGGVDFVFGLNSNPAWAFQNRLRAKPFTITLQGNAGNPQAIGAKVTFKAAGQSPQTAEVYAGSGYLSQSPATLAFSGNSDATVQVRWADGSETTHIARESGSSAQNDGHLVLKMP